MRVDGIVIFAFVIFAFMGKNLPANAQQPSFDCTQARTTQETLICDNPDLAQLDAAISDAYWRLRSNMDTESAKVLLRAQREFLDYRDRQADEEALVRVYEEWQKTLEDIKIDWDVAQRFAAVPGANKRIIKAHMRAWQQGVWNSRRNYRQQRRAAEEATQSLSAEKPYSPADPEIAPPDVLLGSSQRQMRSAALRIIRSDLKHPLRFLLNDAGTGFKPSKGLSEDKLADRPDVIHMGHVISKKVGGPEYIVLQSAWENYYQRRSVEAPHIGGEVLDRPIVSIGGIAVSRETVETWEMFKFIPKGTAASAPRVLLPGRDTKAQSVGCSLLRDRIANFVARAEESKARKEAHNARVAAYNARRPPQNASEADRLQADADAFRAERDRLAYEANALKQEKEGCRRSGNVGGAD